jgi:taurine dioxygenase
MSINIEPEANNFAAKLSACDLNKLSDSLIEEIKIAWQQYSIVYFPNQDLNHQALEKFTAAIGEFGVDPFIKPLPEHPHILELERKPEETATNFGAAWHSDWSFQERPPSATILHSKIIPPTGGDTLFQDCYRAFETLTPTMQSLLTQLNATHSAGFAYSPDGILAAEEKTKTRTMKIVYEKSAEKIQSHPLVRMHPESKRLALYVNPIYTTGIEGMSDGESFALLSFLYAHQQKEQFLYRHKWQENMLLMWDNRCVNHLAEGGYDGHHRLLHRTTVQGEMPSSK